MGVVERLACVSCRSQGTSLVRCQYGLSTGQLIMAYPYKPSSGYYWQLVLRLYWRSSADESLSSPYDASTGTVFIVSTEPVCFDIDLVPHWKVSTVEALSSPYNSSTCASTQRQYRGSMLRYGLNTVPVVKTWPSPVLACQYGSSTVQPVIACPYKPITDFY